MDREADGLLWRGALTIAVIFTLAGALGIALGRTVPLGASVAYILAGALTLGVVIPLATTIAECLAERHARPQPEPERGPVRDPFADLQPFTDPDRLADRR